MRRNDTIAVGDAAEAEAARLLRDRGFEVQNLNDLTKNHMTYDLLAARNGTSFKISVKCARAKRDLSLGPPRSLLRLEEGSFMIAFLPASKGSECRIESGEYELWIVPAEAIKKDALAVHASYWGEDQSKYESNTVRIKDKVDRPNSRSGSGQLFAQWARQYRDGWKFLP